MAEQLAAPPAPSWGHTPHSTATHASPGRPTKKGGTVVAPPSFRATACGYALWITMLPPAMFCGLAESMSMEAPFRLSKTVLPFFVILIRNRS